MSTDRLRSGSVAAFIAAVPVLAVLIGAVLITAVLLIAAPVRAQEGAEGGADASVEEVEPEESPEARARSEEAQRLFHEGVRLLEEGRYESAGAVLERALGLEARASTACNLATALHAQGRSWEAHQLLMRVERQELGVLPPGYAPTVARLREAIDGALARVHLAISAPDRATVYVDDESAGELVRGSVITRVVEPGTHQVRAEADGFVRFQRTVNVNAGSVQRITIELTPREALGAPEEERATPVAASSSRSKRGRRIAIAVGALVAVGVAVTVGVLLARDPGPTCSPPVGCISF